MNVQAIDRCLKEGIKVLWFGSERDRKILSERFPEYVKELFLCVYHSSGSVRLTIIDGNSISENYSKLERLEREDPSFNLKQYEIEHDGDEPLVVVQAGAGSGKTFVMNNRLLYLLHTKEDFHFSDVVMVTFTNEATDSMRKRLIELLNSKFRITGNARYLKWIEDVPQISISTIHSFFKRVIVEVGPLLGYGTNLRLSNMTMERRRILKDIIDQRYGSGSDNVRDTLGLTISDLEKLGMEFWKKIENYGMSGYDVFSMDWGDTEWDTAEKIQNSLRNIFAEVEEKYNTLKLENNALAMGDIIHEFSRVVDDPKIREYISTKYKYLFCDEFQDSDDVQIKTIAVLDKVYDGNLFVVGDIKQSIYRFRGATDSAFERLDENIIREFGDEWIREPYSLAKNYRTSGDILREIDEIFRMWNEEGYLKYKYKGKNNDVLTPQVDIPGEYRQISIYWPSQRERGFISLIDELEEKIGDQKKSIMVLARSNWQLQEVKRWCEKAGKACIIRERGGFFKGPAVRDFCILAEALLYHSEPMYLFNLLRSAYCYKEIDTELLESFSGSHNETLSYLRDLIDEDIEWERMIDELRNRPVMSVFCELIASIKPSVRYGAIQKQRYLMEDYDDDEATKQAVLDAKQYEADLQKLLQILSDSFSYEFSTLPDICNYLRIRISTDKDEESAEVRGLNEMNCIQGSTVHGAKGLEFDYVVIPYMNEAFEKNNRSEILIDKDTKQVGWLFKKGKSDPGVHNVLYESLKQDEAWEVICDETRLLYVAMTRAKEGLYCFTSSERNDGLPQTWSDLLPEEKDDADDL